METTDPFRKVYRQLSPKEKEDLHRMKMKAEELLEMYKELAATQNNPHAARDWALAVTNLQQSLMWATRALT